MKIVVVGGTGLIGAKLVTLLRAEGHEAVPAARSTGIDVVTGAGLDAALDGAAAVVDVSNPGYDDPEAMTSFFEAAGATLLAAERKAGIAHHVTLSAVGAGQIRSGYFRAKSVQEVLVVASDIPFTIVRATPVFEYIYNIVDAGGEGGTIRLPPVQIRPIAAEDLARALLSAATARPRGAVVEVAGPITYTLPALAGEILTAFEDSRDVIVDETAPYFGARIGSQPLTGGGIQGAAPTEFEDWLRRSLIPA